MSRVGNKVIIIDSGVDVDVSEGAVDVRGPKGSLTCKFDAKAVSFFVEDSSIKVVRSSESKAVKAKHGLYRALVANMIEGVSKGFEKKLFMQGIGYRVQLKGNDLEFSLGYSHPVFFKAPLGIVFTVVGQDKFQVAGIDKQLVGEVCAQIKKLRKRDAYKGKGIHFEGDIIRKKAGKSIKK
jgi:large subunit ribosomal protein L6